MALEYWYSNAYDQKMNVFARTVMVWDTKLKQIVKTYPELLISEEELERRKAAMPPITLHR